MNSTDTAINWQAYQEKDDKFPTEYSTDIGKFQLIISYRSQPNGYRTWAMIIQSPRFRPLAECNLDTPDPATAKLLAIDAFQKVMEILIENFSEANEIAKGVLTE